MDHRDALRYSNPRDRDMASLLRLIDVMRCPETFETLTLEEDGQALVSSSGRRWPCIRFVPQMFSGLNVRTYPVDHLSNALAPQAERIIQSASGLVLNLSAGGSEMWHPQVIEAEAGIFRNTDVVADAHNLPFRDNVFSDCIAMNAFEHYGDPMGAAREIYRVLQPGGRVLIHTAFLQPVHEAPFHFFNATPFGVKKWFEPFIEGHLSTPKNFNPVFALSWMLSDLDFGLRGDGKEREANLLGVCTLAEVARFWRDATARQGEVWDAFYAASLEVQGRLAAGVQFTGIKPKG